MRKYLIFIAAIFLLLSCLEKEEKKRPVINIPPPSGGVQAPHIFMENTEGYRCFRIPALVQTTKGTILAFAEGRKDSRADEGKIDLVMRRSEDGGKTWSCLSTIWEDGANTCGNPSPVVGPDGRVHLLMTWNLGTDKIGMINNGTSKDTRRVYYTYSDDDGLTWRKPSEITSQAKKPEWGWYATGPCHAIVMTREPYRNRIVVPCDCIEVGADRKQYSHVIWSDDNGHTWNIGGTVEGGNESTVAELPDGRLILNMRNSSQFRTISYSSDGGKTWTAPEQNRDLIDPVCQGSMLNVYHSGEHTLFFSNAAAEKRRRMTIKKSSDGGKTWTWAMEVYTGHSAYSDIVALKSNELGILYENGVSNSSERISFEKFDINKL